ncbi:MAG: 50S ribosomal protein L22 [Patescibacteria group bacterium]|jgi:large subunit ribosomal protein L22
MTISAQAKFIRMAPRKTRLIVDLVRGRGVKDAEHQLLFSNKDAAKVVLKLLHSAMANAEHNHQLKTDDLVITSAFVNEGPKIHRMTPKAHGRATPIRKRMSHITIVLGTPEEIAVTTKKQSRPARVSKDVKN